MLLILIKVDPQNVDNLPFFFGTLPLLIQGQGLPCKHSKVPKFTSIDYAKRTK